MPAFATVADRIPLPGLDNVRAASEDVKPLVGGVLEGWFALDVHGAILGVDGVRANLPHFHLLLFAAQTSEEQLL